MHAIPSQFHLTVTPTTYKAVDAEPKKLPSRAVVSSLLTRLAWALAFDKRPYHAQLAVE